MSTVFTPYPLVAALQKTEDFLGAQREWNVVNRTQTRFLRESFEPCRQEVTQIKEIESVASYSEEVINRFLRERDFTIQLRPFPPAGFGTASVLDLNVVWQERGRRTKVRTVGELTFPGIYLEEGVEFLESRKVREPVVKLATKSNDAVYIMRWDHPLSEFDLVSTVSDLSLEAADVWYEGVIFPMVDLDLSINTEWLIGLNTQDENGAVAIISQALQQTKFKMNEFGARVKSAAAVGVMRGGPIPYIINSPFLLWIERAGLSKPLFVGHITQENWRDPGLFRNFLPK
ncbi:MAG: hypothetical protein ACPGWR_12605 [Ardenticatenaceae bacterium]